MDVGDVNAGLERSVNNHAMGRCDCGLVRGGLDGL